MTGKRPFAGQALIGALALVFGVAVVAAVPPADGPPVFIQAQPSASMRSDIRVNSNLVLIPVSVTDSGNHPVIGLTSDRFRVFEGKTEQKVRQVLSEDVPLSVGIVLDTSASMAGKLSGAREAIAEFLKSANPEDQFFLVNFNSAVEMAVPFTADTEEVLTRLRNIESSGRTALLDATYLALRHMKNTKYARRALLVISDGVDNHSRYSETEIRRVAKEADVWIYAIGIYSRGVRMLPEEDMGGEKLLTDVAEETGGRHFAVHDAEELRGAAAMIGMQLRNQYVLSYSPVNTELDGKYHRVQVKMVGASGLRISWRQGYYAPARSHILE